MDLHLVGGFLGSGKTTAIIGACKHLMALNKRVGVVTNDQGKYLVDTAFFRLSDVPTVEVGGGCFCCRYEDLAAQLSLIRDTVRPDVVFAESVGSCANVATSVIEPLLKLKEGGSAPTSFSVFADARLLRRHLLGLPMPFQENVVYIFEKQIEEAGLLVINKIDLLTAEQAQEIEGLARQRFSSGIVHRKRIWQQNSLDADSVAHWVSLIREGNLLLPEEPLDLDYRRYADGEAQLAWLDEKVTWTAVEGQGSSVAMHLIETMIAEIRQRQIPIGHIKFIVRGRGEPSCAPFETKISFTTLGEEGQSPQVPPLAGTQVEMLINARVEMPAAALRDLVRQAIEQTASAAGATYAESEVAFFHPEVPIPRET